MKLKVIIETGNDTDQLDMSFLPKDWNVEIVLLEKATYVAKIKTFPKDCIVINLCDGIDEIGQLGECVIRELEKNNLPYTGSSIKSYKCKKSDLKLPGIATPKCAIIRQRKYEKEMFDHLAFPVIIKPEYNSGSVGITLKSKAENIDDLLNKLKDYDHDDAVIEEFIEGREFTVLVMENLDDPMNPIVLEPIECVFGNGHTFKHFDLKWKDYRDLRYECIDNKIIVDDINKIARDTYLKLGLDGYIRYDIRMDKDGQMYVIDTNPYCAIFYPKGNEGCADFILLKSKIMNNVTFVEHNIKCAIARAKNY